MLFNSYHFILFFPIVCLVYFVMPRRYQYLWLLATSYYFYMSWNAKYALLLLFSTAITYGSGLLIHRANQAKAELLHAPEAVAHGGIVLRHADRDRLASLPFTRTKSFGHGSQQTDRHKLRCDQHGDAQRHGQDRAPGSGGLFIFEV